MLWLFQNISLPGELFFRKTDLVICQFEDIAIEVWEVVKLQEFDVAVALWKNWFSSKIDKHGFRDDFLRCVRPGLYNNCSMSPSWIWSDKITNERVARVGYNHFISNKGEWNNCFSKFSNRVLPPIFISTILQRKFLNLAHYFHMT